MLQFDAEASRRVEATYTTPDVVEQRQAVLGALALGPGERVIDIGTGPGLLAAEIAAAVGPDGLVCGIDISDSMLALARARTTRPNSAPMEFRQAGADRLPYAQASFDVAVATQVLEVVVDPWQLKQPPAGDVLGQVAAASPSGWRWSAEPGTSGRSAGLVESGEAEAGDLLGLSAGGDPAGQGLAGGRCHEQAVAVMAGAHPSVVEAGHAINHRLPVGGGRTETAPLVAHPHLGGGREQRTQPTPDALDDLGADLGRVVALVAGPAGQQPAINHGPHPKARTMHTAPQAEPDWLSRDQVALDQPLRHPHPGFGGQPGGEHHHPWVQITDSGPNPHDAATAHLQVGHGHAGGHTAGPPGQGRRQPQGMHTGLVMGQQPGRHRDQLWNQLGHPLAIEQLHPRPWFPRRRPLRQQLQPCHPLQPQRSIPVLVELVVERQAGPGQRHKARRVA
jgi:SAM-dependent methyltransferase